MDFLLLGHSTNFGKCIQYQIAESKFVKLSMCMCLTNLQPKAAQFLINDSQHCILYLLFSFCFHISCSKNDTSCTPQSVP